MHVQSPVVGSHFFEFFLLQGQVSHDGEPRADEYMRSSSPQYVKADAPLFPPVEYPMGALQQLDNPLRFATVPGSHSVQFS